MSQNWSKVARTLRFQCRGPGLISGQGTRIPHTTVKSTFIPAGDPQATTKTEKILSAFGEDQCSQTNK